MATAPPAHLLRIIHENDDKPEFNNGKQTVELTPLCVESLQKCFDLFDQDKDCALNFQELSAYIRFTEGVEFSKPYFENLTKVVNTNEAGDVTLEGLIRLYLFSYDEKGLLEGDKNLWKDLTLFGFQPDLTHSGEMPNVTMKKPETVRNPNLNQNTVKEEEFIVVNETKDEIEIDAHKKRKLEGETPTNLGDVVNLAKKRKTPKDAFAMLRCRTNKQESRRPPGKGKKKEKPKQKNVITKDTEEVSIVHVITSPPLQANEVQIVEQPGSDITAALKKVGNNKNQENLNPFFFQRSKSKPKNKEIISIDACPTPKAQPKNKRVWSLPEFPTCETGVHVNFGSSPLHAKSIEPEPIPAMDLSSVNVDGNNSDYFKNYNFGFATLEEQNPGFLRTRFKRIVYAFSKWDKGTVTEYLLSPSFRELVESIMGKILSLEFFADSYRFARIERMLQQKYDTRLSMNESRWADMYRPHNSEDFLGNEAPAGRLEQWLLTWNPKDAACDNDYDDDYEDSNWSYGGMCKGLLLVGPTGSGKSSLVYCCANSVGRKVIEVNASSIRSGQDLQQLVGEATQSHTLKSRSKSKQGQGLAKALLLLDECDIVFNEDKGFGSAILHILQVAKIPVVLTCNVLPQAVRDKTGFSSKIPSLEVLTVHRPDKYSLTHRMIDICLAEGLGIPSEHISSIVHIHERDPRLCLNTLQFWCKGVAAKKLDKKTSNSKWYFIEMSMPLYWNKLYRSHNYLTPSRLFELHDMDNKSCGGLDSFTVPECTGVGGEDDGGTTSPSRPKSLNLDAIFPMYRSLSASLQESVLKVEAVQNSDIPITVKGINPNKGTIYGGTRIEITGEGFSNPQILRIQVFVGEAICETVEIASGQIIFTVCPAYKGKIAQVTQNSSEEVEDTIEEYDSDDDFVESCRGNKTSRNKNKLWPSDVVIRAVLRNGSIISSNDELEHRHNGLFQYAVEPKIAQQQNQQQQQQSISESNNCTDTVVNKIQILQELCENMSLCDILSCPIPTSGCGRVRRELSRRIGLPCQIIDIEDDSKNSSSGTCKLLPSLGGFIEFSSCTGALNLWKKEVSNNLQICEKQSQPDFESLIDKQESFADILYRVTPQIIVGSPSLCGRCAIHSRYVNGGLIEYIGLETWLS